MARIIYFSVDLHGHVNPSLGLVGKLIEQGEEVIYYSGDEFQEVIEGTGAAFRSYHGHLGVETHDDGGINSFLMFAGFILQKNREIVDYFWDEIRALQPDYIIHDSLNYFGKVFADRLNIPGISVFASFAYIDEMAKIDPEFFMVTYLRAGDDPLYAKNKGRANVYGKLLDTMSRRLAASYGLDRINIINDLFCSKEDLNILFTSRELQLHAEAFDDTYWFSGYTISPRQQQPDFPYDLLGGRPLVYISFGTIFNELPELYRTCISAFGDTDVQVVIALGHRVDAADLGFLPANIIVRNEVPQLEILKRADVFITHGGANSVHEALCFEVPMAVVPQSFDQFVGGLTVERSGAGINLQDREVTSELLQETVRKLLTEPHYKEKCRAIRVSFEASGGLDGAAERIRAFAGRESVYEK
ncbi:macrolide family glycosyltransferase [Paenibacillus sp. sgz500958]|uniref:macrolide family glycosyltransferase n=1 Tax=Paenibacillus sp. sgz500958 TaxID=3242475 RepID=UPI0036D3E059